VEEKRRRKEMKCGNRGQDKYHKFALKSLALISQKTLPILTFRHLLIAGLDEIKNHSTGSKKSYMPLPILSYITFMIQDKFV
jgi:hypothetical protein